MLSVKMINMLLYSVIVSAGNLKCCQPWSWTCVLFGDFQCFV